MEHFSRLKKIDAHTHIGAFGSPFNIDFNTERLLEQMDIYNIEKTILCSSSAYSNDDTLKAYKQHPDKIIPLMWVNCAQGQPAYDLLEHYFRDEHLPVRNCSRCSMVILLMLPVLTLLQNCVRSMANHCLYILAIHLFLCLGKLGC